MKHQNYFEFLNSNEFMAHFCVSQPGTTPTKAPSVIATFTKAEEVDAKEGGESDEDDKP